MGRAPCCDKENVKKGPWSPEEDTKLKEYIEKQGTGGNWIALPYKAGLKRCGKSCRLRWLNYLRPNIKHGDFSDDEDRIICTLFASIGSRWSIIAAQLQGRTDNDVKNYWNTKLKKKLLGIPPSQKKPNQQQQQEKQENYQLLFQSSLQNTAPPSSSQGSCCDNLPKPLHTGLECFPFSSDLLNISHHVQQDSVHQFQMDNSSLLVFNSEQSCSSSDGSCNQISCGKEEFGIGFESYLYDGMEETQKILFGGGDGGEASLEYSYEEIKQLASTNFGCNSIHLDDPSSVGARIEDTSFKTQGRVMYY